MPRARNKRQAQVFAVGEPGPRLRPTKRQRTNMTAYEEVCLLLSETHLCEDPEVTTVKCKLASVLVNPPEDAAKAAIAEFVAEIEQSVRTLHQIRMEGSRLSNLHFLRCIEEDLPLPAFNREFFARCLAGAGLPRFDATHEHWDPELYRTIVQYRSARAETAGYEQFRIATWSASKNAMAEEMLTNAKVMLKEQYYKRTMSYCKLRFNIASNSEMYWQFKEAYEFGGGVSGPIRDAAAHLREFLKTQPTATNIEKEKAYFFERQYEMLKYIAAHIVDKEERRRGIRLFSLLPLTTEFVPGHMAISTTVLLDTWHRLREHLEKRSRLDLDPLKGFMRRSERGGLRYPKMSEFSQVKDEAWRCLANARKFETGRWRLTTSSRRTATKRASTSLVSSTPDKAPRSQIASTFNLGFLGTISQRVSSATTLEYATCVLRHQGVRRLTRRSTPTSSTASGRSSELRILRRLGWRLRMRRRRKRQRRLKVKQRALNGPETWREFRRHQRPEQQHGRARQHDVTSASCSTKEYRHLAGFNQREYWFENLKKREPVYAALLANMPSFRCASTQDYWVWLSYFWKHVNFLIDFSSTHAFRRWRFRNYVYKFKALGYVAARVVPVPDDSTLVGVGEFSNPRGLRGNAVPPLTDFAKELSRRATVRLIDEYFTSKKCFACHGDLTETEFRRRRRAEPEEEPPAQAEEPPPPEPQARGVPAHPRATRTRNVLHCTNSTCRMYWDRDDNAARNLMFVTEELAHGRPRPDYMQRSRRRDQ